MKVQKSDRCNAISRIPCFLLLSSLFVSCAPTPLTRLSAATQQPYVLSVTPAAGSEISDAERIDLHFSRPLLPSTVTQNTVFIVSQDIYETYQEDEWDDLADDVQDGSVDVIDGEIALSDDATHVYYAPTEDFPAAGEYIVVALPKITTTDHYPLDQTVVGDLTRQFQSSFLVNTTTPESIQMADAATDSTDAAESAQSETAENSSQDESATIASDEVAATEQSEESVTDSATSVSETQIAVPETPEFDFSRVLITEVVTDPQQDHAESSSGNGVAFDAIPGTGSLGSTDEYVELYNGTSESLDLRGWQLTMTDGTDVTQALDDSSWSLFFSDGGTVDNFLAGEVLVLGNPKGDLKNTVQLDLTDEVGDLVETLSVEDANATGLDDESYKLDNAGMWGMDEASPGEVEF